MHMDTTSTLLFIALAIILLLALLEDKIRQSPAYKRLQKWWHNNLMRIPPSSDLFHSWLAVFFTSIGIVVALRLAGIRSVAMTIFEIMMYVSFVVVVLVAMRIARQPKDTRLNTLSSDVQQVKESLKRIEGNQLDRETAIQLIKAIQELTKALHNGKVVG